MKGGSHEKTNTPDCRHPDRFPCSQRRQRIREILESKEKRQNIRAALKKLTPAQQNILALRFGVGYSLEQTAEAIGKKVIKEGFEFLSKNVGERFTQNDLHLF